MTETSPIGTVAAPTAEVEELSVEERTRELLKQGRPRWGVELRITDRDGRLVPRDGTSSGALSIRGPWVVSSYIKREGERMLHADGWLSTGDIANWDAYGFV